MSKPVVVGIDDGPDSAAALRWAINEATQRGARLMSCPLAVIHDS